MKTFLKVKVIIGILITFVLLISLSVCSTPEKDVWLDLYIYNDCENDSIDVYVIYNFDTIYDYEGTFNNIEPGDYARFKTGVVGSMGGFLDTTGEGRVRFEIKYSDSEHIQSNKIYHFPGEFDSGGLRWQEMYGERSYSFKDGNITAKEKDSL